MEANLLPSSSADPCLIVGCSFIEMLSLHAPVNQNNLHQWPLFFCHIDTERYDIWGAAGSGNAAIAQRVLYQLSRRRYRRVIVVWSGVNRLDISVGREWHETMPRVSEHEYKFNYFTDLGETIWYHCGGYFGPKNPDIPGPLREMFRTQLLGASRRFLTDLTLSNVIMLQAVLEKQGVDYAMSWMYDPRRAYSEPTIEPGCGQLDESSPLMAMVDWTKIDSRTAYEWSQDRGMVYPDGFHWSWEGGRQWLLEVMGEDIFFH